MRRAILRTGSFKTILDTYYVYDELGNVVTVLPPEASEVFRVSSSSSKKERSYFFHQHLL